jgi:hypothetical protein
MRTRHQREMNSTRRDDCTYLTSTREPAHEECEEADGIKNHLCITQKFYKVIAKDAQLPPITLVAASDRYP